MEWMPAVLNWILGLVTLAVVGIVGMHVRLSVFVQRLISHEETCSLLHQAHTETAKQLWEAVNAKR